MTSKHLAIAALLLPSGFAALALAAAAQTAEEEPTNCCTEIYWAGWELGSLEAIVTYTIPDDAQVAELHMQRLGTRLQAANESCCKFCEAWDDWEQAQQEIKTVAAEFLSSPQVDPQTARLALQEWVDGRPADLIAGLSRCDLDDDMPCKWLGLVECARAYFQLGVELGHADYALAVAREGIEPGPAAKLAVGEAGLESLQEALRLLTSLRGADGPSSGDQTMRCEFLWGTETGAERLLAEAIREANDTSADRLAKAASEAHELVLELLLHGRPDFGLPPCPIGADHEHEDCERAAQHRF